ncbi:MAG: hypothetical protein O6928_02975 [Gammaproteobacteria bacterium]|nr:hypothetical protein [Gammaproteobacteria bacterium]
MRHLTDLFCLRQLVLVAALLTGCAAGAAEPDADFLFNQAQALYDMNDYEHALTPIKQAVSLAPEESDYHHLLAKCYGKLAENSNWFKALSLARKTHSSLEKAVNLDRNNVSALKDLMKYYRQAPGFLGGDKDKADEIERFLADADATS